MHYIANSIRLLPLLFIDKNAQTVALAISPSHTSFVFTGLEG